MLPGPPPGTGRETARAARRTGVYQHGHSATLLRVKLPRTTTFPRLHHHHCSAATTYYELPNHTTRLHGTRGELSSLQEEKARIQRGILRTGKIAPRTLASGSQPLATAICATSPAKPVTTTLKAPQRGRKRQEHVRDKCDAREFGCERRR